MKWEEILLYFYKSNNIIMPKEFGVFRVGCEIAMIFIMKPSVFRYGVDLAVLDICGKIIRILSK